MKHLTDSSLLSDVKINSRQVKNSLYLLLLHLTEIHKRFLYCDLGYSSLYAYITNELKFCDSQAVIFQQLIRAKVMNLPEVKNLFLQGEISLYALSILAREINFELLEDEAEIIKRLHLIKGSNREELKMRLLKSRQQHQQLVKLDLDQLLVKKLEQVNQKLKLNLGLAQLLHYLADEKLGLEVRQELKSITPKIKRYLLHLAHYQCQYIAEGGNRCEEKNYLEIDHIKMKSMGGGNELANLRVLCRKHNQRASFKQIKKVNFKV